MAGKRIVISGISGINTDKTLKKFTSYCNSKHTNFQFLCLSDYIHKIQKLVFEGITWYEILQLPYQKLNELCDIAIDLILTEIESDPSKNYALVIHASFYHQFTREFISFVNLEKIKVFNPSLFINFIDDLDDIHARLKNDGQMFNKAFGGAEEDNSENIIELLQILNWRANEIVLTRYYANQLKKPFYLFAVKHPCETLFKLIFQSAGKKIFYLSHPISKIRELFYKKQIQEAELEIQKINKLTENLSEETICFFPTSIDELRLKINEDHNIEHSIRWYEKGYSKERDNILFIPTKNKNYIPYNEININKLNTSDEVDEKIKTNLVYTLSYYLNQVKNQVGIRDKILVEQSNALFIYRPYLNGRISRGVNTEIQYAKVLYARDDNTKIKFGLIYFPEEDKIDTKIYQLILGIKSFIKDCEYFSFDKSKSDQFNSLIFDSFKEEILDNFNNVNNLGSVIKKIIDNSISNKIINKMPNFEEQPLDSGRASILNNYYIEYSKKINSSYNNIISDLENHFEIFDNELDTNRKLKSFLTN